MTWLAIGLVLAALLGIFIYGALGPAWDEHGWKIGATGRWGEGADGYPTVFWDSEEDAPRALSWLGLAFLFAIYTAVSCFLLFTAVKLALG